MELGLDAGGASPRVTASVYGRRTALTGRRTRVGAAPDAPDAECWPELDCVERRLPRATIAAARKRAAALGIGADRTLVAAGHLSEETFLRALAESLGVAFETLDDVTRTHCPVHDTTLIEGTEKGLLPLSDGDEWALVVAPREQAVRRLIAMLQSNPALARRFRFTTSERFNRFILRCAGKALVSHATKRLQQVYPKLSAGPSHKARNPLRPALAGMAALAGIVIAPTSTLHATTVMLAVLFLAWLGLRLAAAFIPVSQPPQTTMRDDALPTYSVIAALYREAASVDGLLRTIEQLDYPTEKLQVLVALEADDRETRAAITARRYNMPVSVVIVPPEGPRTKPKALNVALSFARGTFTVIYDAEDRPEPDQLRRALQAFASGGETLACVQARLCIDNTADSWLARLFTAEYAGQFDAFLPGLATGHLPLPLGGSSNHFHTATLRDVGAWDPYNVTEDADLGMRLARFGYRAGMINSTTYEEAPARLGAWLRQRTRWFKGWMTTWLVHMREPRRLLHELGWAGFCCFQLIVGGNVLAALTHLLFLVGLAAAVLTGVPLWTDDTLAGMVLPSIYVSTVALGYLVSAGLGWLGLSRRGLTANVWVLLLMPVHWLLLSIAAWRALYQLIAAPYVWEKTTHGIARHSRRDEELTCSLVELEHHLRALKKRAENAGPDEGTRARGPVCPDAPTCTSAAPRPPRPACA